MSVVELLPPLFAGRVQVRAVGHDDVVAAVGRRVPDRLVLAHEQNGDAGGEAAEGGGREGRRLRRGERPDRGEGVVWCCGGDVMPCSRVGKFGLGAVRTEYPEQIWGTVLNHWSATLFPLFLFSSFLEAYWVDGEIEGGRGRVRGWAGSPVYVSSRCQNGSRNFWDTKLCLDSAAFHRHHPSSAWHFKSRPFPSLPQLPPYLSQEQSSESFFVIFANLAFTKWRLKPLSKLVLTFCLNWLYHVCSTNPSRLYLQCP